MTRQDLGVRWKDEDFVLYAYKFLTIVSAWQVCTTYAHAEKCVASENDTSVGYIIANSTWCMAWCMNHLNGDIAKMKHGGFANTWVCLWQNG